MKCKNVILIDRRSAFKLLLFSLPLHPTHHLLALWPWANSQPFTPNIYKKQRVIPYLGIYRWRIRPGSQLKFLPFLRCVWDRRHWEGPVLVPSSSSGGPQHLVKDPTQVVNVIFLEDSSYASLWLPCWVSSTCLGPASPPLVCLETRRLVLMDRSLQLDRRRRVRLGDWLLGSMLATPPPLALRAWSGGKVGGNGSPLPLILHCFTISYWFLITLATPL